MAPNGNNGFDNISSAELNYGTVQLRFMRFAEQMRFYQKKQCGFEKKTVRFWQKKKINLLIRLEIKFFR